MSADGNSPCPVSLQHKPATVCSQLTHVPSPWGSSWYLVALAACYAAEAISQRSRGWLLHSTGSTAAAASQYSLNNKNTYNNNSTTTDNLTVPQAAGASFAFLGFALNVLH